MDTRLHRTLFLAAVETVFQMGVANPIGDCCIAAPACDDRRAPRRESGGSARHAAAVARSKYEAYSLAQRLAVDNITLFIFSNRLCRGHWIGICRSRRALLAGAQPRHVCRIVPGSKNPGTERIEHPGSESSPPGPPRQRVRRACALLDLPRSRDQRSQCITSALATRKIRAGARGREQGSRSPPRLSAAAASRHCGHPAPAAQRWR
jgi:hypothetical protein